MKTITAKYPGTCCNCNGAIQRGSTIKFYGRGRAAHFNCETPASEVRAACWVCGAPDGKFRNLGAATPVWCDACNAKEMAKQARRDNSSAEDSCCGDIAYDDACARACGL